MEEQIHLYIRERETGRFITHFLFPKKYWDELERVANLRGITMDELFKEIIQKAIEAPLAQ